MAFTNIKGTTITLPNKILSLAEALGLNCYSQELIRITFPFNCKAASIS